MNENEKDLQPKLEDELEEFDLDEILKEFGGLAEEGEEPELPEPEIGEEEPEVPSDAPEAPADEPTIRLDLPVAQDAPAAKGDTVRFEPAKQPEDAPVDLEATQTFGSVEVPQKKTEPFSKGWEPEYEQPIGEYVPPQPIIFRPRSKLRELKRKLVAGPERRYYELSELGLGKLQAAIFLNFLLVLLSAGATVMYAMGMVPDDRMRLLVFGQFFIMLVSALLGSFQLIEGVADLFQKKFTLNTMLVFTFIACCVDGVLGLQELRVSCCAAFSLEMTMSLWNACQKRNVEMGQMDTLRKAVRLDSIVAQADYFDGRKGLLRGEGQVEDFMENYNALSKPEKVINAYALIALLISIGAGVAAGVLHSISLGVQVLAVSLLAAVPATAFIAVSRPMAVLERRLHKLGTVLCGWQGVEGMSGKAAFPLDHNDLFPVGATKLNGVKFYGDRDPDEVVAYAAALIDANGGGLKPLFDYLLDSRNGRHYEVENLQFYPGGGIGGEVCGEPVLVGALSFMKEMGVEIPEGTRVNQAVYASIDGELAGLFAITYEKERSSAAGLSTLCSYRSLKPVLISGDFMLTADFIRGRFGANTRRMAFPERPVREELAAVEPGQDAVSLAITTMPGLAPLAYAVTGAKALRTACNIGVVIHLIGGLLGLAMMVALAVLGEGRLLTPANMFLYQLVWMIPGLLVTEWTRSI